MSWYARPASRRFRRRSTHGESSRCPWLDASTPDPARAADIGAVVVAVRRRLRRYELADRPAPRVARAALVVRLGTDVHPLRAAAACGVYFDRPVFLRGAVA